MTTGVMGPRRADIDAKTMRQDRWWLAPLTTFVIFTAFVIYASWRAFAGEHYYSTPYLSPFYSPCLTDSCVEGSSDFGQPFSWWQLSPALLILIFPLGFRMTCYYYRKAYYRAFWLSPPACAVAEPHKGYSGENRLPLILQNIHRYFWYAAVVVSAILHLRHRARVSRRGRRLGSHGPRHGHHAGQHRVDLALHRVVPLMSPRGRRQTAPLLQTSHPLWAVDSGLEAQPEARPVRMAVPVLRGHRRPLHLPARVWAVR
ncbi:MAG: hypothetical protein WKF73_01940 [Nocardioidaceae bacterium]